MTVDCHSSFFNQVETQQKADETSKLPPHMQKKGRRDSGILEKMLRYFEEHRQNNTFPNRKGENSLNSCWGHIR